MLNNFGFRWKCMSRYLSGANVAPCVRAHSAQTSCALSSLRQLSSVERIKARMLVSSTNPAALVCWLLSSGKSVDAKYWNEIGERVEPCGIPVDTARVVLQCSPSVRYVVGSLRNEQTYCVVQAGIPAIRRFWISLSWDTLSNAPDMSSPSNITSTVKPAAHIVRTCSTRSLDSRHRRSLLPRSHLSVREEAVNLRQRGDLQCDDAFEHFPERIRIAMGRYALGVSHVGFPGFCRTIVFTCRNGVG